MITLAVGVKDRESRGARDEARRQDRRVLCQCKVTREWVEGWAGEGWTPEKERGDRIHGAWYPRGIDMRDQKGLRCAASLS